MMEINGALREKTADASAVRAESHGSFYEMDTHKQLDTSPVEEAFRAAAVKRRLPAYRSDSFGSAVDWSAGWVLDRHRF
jgi:hypothetical protein